MNVTDLQSLIEQCGVHPELGAAGLGWNIEQNAEELAQFLTEMQELGVQSILEVGTGPNAGLARFMHEKLSWSVTSIDVNAPYYRHDAIAFYQIEHGQFRTFEQGFDLVFIDADHAYESVKADHAWYGTYALKVVAFHDICGLRECEGTARYWGEIAFESLNLKHRYYQAIAEGDKRVGIGWQVLAEKEKTVVPQTGDVLEYEGLDTHIREGYVSAIPEPKPEVIVQTPKRRGRPKKASA